MGMESFFAKISVSNDGVINSKALNNSLIAHLNDRKFKTVKTSSWFTIIDDLVEMGIDDNNDVYEITFAGCFSCFSTTCRLMDDLISSLFVHYNVKSIVIHGKEIEISRRDFTDILYNEYEEKYQWFKANLTDKSFNSSPSTFYKKLRRIKRLGPLWRLWV